MELHSLRVRNYRCIDDSGWVPVENLTCFVGKNESGKTGFMEAIENLNPVHATGDYTPHEDYPRHEWPAYSDRHDDDPDIVVSARCTLDEAVIDEIESETREGLIEDPELTVHRDYRNDLRWELAFDGTECVSHLLSAYDLPESLRDQLRDVNELAELSDYDTDDEGPYAELCGELGGPPQDVISDEIGTQYVRDRLPVFQFIGEYSVMDGTIEIESLLERREADDLTRGDRVFLSLLSIAGLELEEFRDVEDWREKTAELEAASARISDEIMQYWSQSGDLQIRIQGTTAGDGDDDRRMLDVRVEDRTHNVTIEFEGRSRGFRRFFSTFCQLRDLENRERDVVVMLDEPGLNLHARAKQEFLTFLKTELTPEFPIIYTTHSPFMIDPETLHRVKMVRADPVGDENVFSDITLADAYTSFPLRNVFEFDLMDTLLVQPQTLLVESKADHVYLSVLSKLLHDIEENGLDHRWTVVPITDAGNIRSFVSLFGEELDVAALLNDAPTREQRRADRTETDLLDEIPISLIPEYSDSGGEATIEDVLSDAFYFELVNRTYASEIGTTDGIPDRLSPEEVRGGYTDTAVVEQLRSYFERHGINDGVFDRADPALYLQDNRTDMAQELGRDSRRSFTRLFTDLNNTLESFESVEPSGGSFLGNLFG